mmetsp:Transcript_28458/g.47304  ORF Transcript_28458/g.47304 Transcript_28458/m.47304 type:complete len:105 (-) Transcript_28458:2531-2845(-)
MISPINGTASSGEEEVRVVADSMSQRLSRNTIRNGGVWYVIFGIIVIKEIVSDAVRRGGWIPRETRSEQPQLPQRSLQHGGHPSLKRMDRTMCSTVAPECSTNH